MIARSSCSTQMAIFNAKALAVLMQSFVDLGLLKTKPRNDELFTTKFPPVKP